jgi:hypothetical protein
LVGDVHAKCSDLERKMIKLEAGHMSPSVKTPGYGSPVDDNPRSLSSPIAKPKIPSEWQSRIRTKVKLIMLENPHLSLTVKADREVTHFFSNKKEDKDATDFVIEVLRSIDVRDPEGFMKAYDPGVSTGPTSSA